MRGITVTLYNRVQAGKDAFNVPVYLETTESVDNVLVTPMNSTEVLETYNLTGRRAAYQLGIPKGDTHDWSAGKKVGFFGHTWRIIAIPTEGIEHLIPLSWNKKVQVELYEQG